MVIISENLPESQILPKSIDLLFDFILANLGIRHSFIDDSKDTCIKSLTNKEQEKIEETLKNLGYLWEYHDIKRN